MKTKELIRRLQEADPSGEAECVVDNHDIYFLDTVEGYWDGHHEVLVRDEAEQHFFNVIGAKISGRGRKVRLNVLPIEEVMLGFNMPDLPVDLSECGVHQRHRYEEAVERWRQEARRASTELAAMRAKKKEKPNDSSA